MTFSELEAILSRRPFQPVEVTTTDGRRFLIPNSERFLLLRDALSVQTEDVCEERMSPGKIESVVGVASPEVGLTRCLSESIDGMAYSELKRLLDNRPFQPIVVTTTDGRQFTLNHPEMFLLMKSLLFIQISESLVENVSLLRIVSATVQASEPAAG